MSVVLTLNDASLSIVDLHAAMQQGCQKREGPGGWRGVDLGYISYPHLNQGWWIIPNTLLLAPPDVSFSSCKRNLIKTFQIEAMIALITKMAMIFS